jgi:hypothetical protein
VHCDTSAEQKKKVFEKKEQPRCGELSAQLARLLVSCQWRN